MLLATALCATITMGVSKRITCRRKCSELKAVIDLVVSNEIDRYLNAFPASNSGNKSKVDYCSTEETFGYFGVYYGETLVVESTGNGPQVEFDIAIVLPQNYLGSPRIEICSKNTKASLKLSSNLSEAIQCHCDWVDIKHKIKTQFVPSPF